MNEQAQPTRIDTLIAVHAAAGVLLATAAFFSPADIWPQFCNVAYGAFVISETQLLGMWIGLVRARLHTKLLGSLLGLGALGGMILATKPYALDFFVALIFLVVSLFGVSCSFFMCRKAIASILWRRDWEARPISQEVQFTLKFMLYLVTFVSVILALGGIVRQMGGEHIGIIWVSFVFGLCAILTTSLQAWATLGLRRLKVQLPLMVLGLASALIVPPYYLDWDGWQFLRWFVLNSLAVTLVVFSLLVVRRSGYRLVSIRREDVGSDRQVIHTTAEPE